MILRTVIINFKSISGYYSGSYINPII